MNSKDRSKRGVLASIKEKDDGKLHLTLDDLVNSSDGKTWIFDGLITVKDYDKEVLEDLSFDEKELAEFGYYILSRLYAYYKRNEL